MSNYGTVATLPLAHGTPHNCYYYYNHPVSLNTPAPAQQHLQAPAPQTCETIARIINIDVEQLIKLNPSLDSNNCTLEPGYSYCAHKAAPTRSCKHPRDASSSQRLIRVAHSTSTPDPPICSFDPSKGEYICPDPPLCRFDPEKGEYECPDASSTAVPGQEAGEEREELR